MKTLILVVGAAGTPEYGETFQQWALRWEDAAKRAGVQVLRIGTEPEGEATDRQHLEQAFARVPRDGEAELWFVYIGHGTWDRARARLNLRGPDVEAEQLSTWLAPFERPVAAVLCSASSGPFINALSHKNRVVITATKSGDEYSFARFGDYLSQAIGSLEADIDKDAQVSLHEAYLHASAKLAAFYDSESRLATEHPLLDDNGDGYGTPADWFRGVRCEKTPADGRFADGVFAHRWHLVESEAEQQLAPEVRRKRADLERKVEELRLRKAEWSTEDYYSQLEELMVQLARLALRR